MLIFFASFLVKEPTYNDSTRNEKIKLGKRIFFASLIVNVIKVFIKQFLIYDLLVAITVSMVVYIFYKIFVNALGLITNYNEKMAFSIEEVLASSLLASIALCALQDIQILGFSIRNVLSIFIVLVLGWKNGILVGTTAGATIGVTLGIIANSEPMVVASYAISGMIAGILNRFGKIGVICGFVLGNVVLSYVSNGLISNLIVFKEILIAVPRNINLKIENIIGENKFLPIGVNRGLNKSKETVSKLNNVSKMVNEMANTYKDVAATVVDEQDIKEKNKQTFIAELLNNIENMKENILYDSIENVEGEIVDEIFNKLLEKQFIKEKDLIKILAKNNNYVVGFGEDEEKLDRDIEKMTQAINSAYRIGKMNFVWSARLKEEKQNFESQLKGVSKAISNIAKNLDEENYAQELFDDKKEQIALILKQKEILLQEISITKKDGGRFNVELYIEQNDRNDIKDIKMLATGNPHIRRKNVCYRRKKCKERKLH